MRRLALTVALFIAGLASAAQPKYVFLFIGDGMSTPQRMIAEEFSRAIGRGSLAMNAMPYQATTRTCSADSLVTDSAAAATAIACGQKTNNHYMGVDPEGRPLESCAVVAKKAGKKVGIVSTVTLTHATPAGFYAHRKSRGELYGIAIDLVHSRFDFFAGGGLDRYYKDQSHPEFATYGHAYHYAAKEGYRIVKTRDEFLSLKPSDGKVLTRFRDDALDNAIDAKDGKDPTLAEIVSKAIEMLDGEKGFFLMAEGGRVDWAGHANDAATNLREVLALDEAVKVALAFQEKHPDETLIVVTGDHETGGLSMGFSGTGYAIYPKRLAQQTMSIERFDEKVKQFLNAHTDATFASIKPLITEAFGFLFEPQAGDASMVLTPHETADLRAAFDHDVAFHKAQVIENTKYDGEKRYLFGGACRVVMSHKCGLNWGSSAHTAMPVITTAKGVGAEAFTGFIENTGISDRIKALYR